MTVPTTAAGFLEQLTLRNRGLVRAADQARLSAARFLIAGCGSTGGAAIEPLVRAGATRLILVEPGAYELSNLNRQHARLIAIGRNKADWLAGAARDVNPHLDVEALTEGITSDNAARLAAAADVVIDAVDMTTVAGLRAKYALHEAASAARRPTVSAYDLAYRQYIRVYDYRRGLAPLGGRVRRLRQAASPVQALALLVPFWAIPRDFLAEAERLLDQPGASVGQLGCTADLFGALIVPLAIELLACRPVRASFTVDLKDAILPAWRRWGRRLAALAGLLRLQVRLWQGREGAGRRRA